MYRPLIFMLSVISTVKYRLNREESGATAVEYGLLIGLIAVVLIGVVALLGNQLQAVFGHMAKALNGRN